jgi:polyisoprenoid-binding protein YceI
MIKAKTQKIMFTFLALLPILCQAEVANWEIVPKESTISFTATQNNAPVTGQFKTFSGEIKGDPTKLDTCSVKITVDINSVFDAYNQLSDTLKTAEWFNAKQFPQAIFQSSQFVKTGDKSYEAKGNLTIRGKTVPITLKFSEEENTGSKGRVKGSTLVKRTDFGVGQGEWADTKAVKDEVQVDFTLTALKK